MNTDLLNTLADHVYSMYPEQYSGRSIAQHLLAMCGIDKAHLEAPESILRVAETLGVEWGTASTLCYPSEQEDGINWFDVPQEVAADQIRHLAETGTVDWSATPLSDYS